MAIEDTIRNLKSSKSYNNQIAHIEDIPHKEPEYSSIELKPLINWDQFLLGHSIHFQSNRNIF